MVQQVRQASVKFFQGFGVPLGIIAMTIQHIKIHKIHKKESVISTVGQEFLGFSDAKRISFERIRNIKKLCGKNITDLPYAHSDDLCFLHFIQKIGKRRRQRKIFAIRRAFKMSRRPPKGTGDDSPYSMTPLANLSGFAAKFI